MSETETILGACLGLVAASAVFVWAGAWLESRTHAIQIRRWHRANARVARDTTAGVRRLYCIEGGRVAALSGRTRGGRF